MRYLTTQLSKEAEILLNFSWQDPLKYDLVVQTQTMNYTYIYCITRRVNFSIGLIFKTFFYHENDVINF